MSWRNFLGVLALGAAWFAAYRFISLEDVLIRYDMARAVALQNPLPVMAGYFLIYAGLVGAGMPVAFLMTWVGAALFGAIIGGSVAILAASTGATMLFLLARSLFRPYFRHRISHWFDRIKSEFHADAASYLLFARFTPVFPFVVTNVSAALLGARLQTFIWTTMLGIVPGTFAYAIIGEGLDQVFHSEGQRLALCRQSGTACAATLDLAAFISPKIMLGLAGLAAIMLISIVARRFWLRDTKTPCLGNEHKG